MPRPRRTILCVLTAALLLVVAAGLPGTAHVSVAIREFGGPVPGHFMLSGAFTVTRFGVTLRHGRVGEGERATMRLRPGLYTFEYSSGSLDCGTNVWLWPGSRQDVNIDCSVK